VEQAHGEYPAAASCGMVEAVAPLALSRAKNSGVVFEPVASRARAGGGSCARRERATARAGQKTSATDLTGPGSAAAHRPLGISLAPKGLSFRE